MGTEERPVFQGKYYTIDQPINMPKGARQAHPEFWLGGGGEKVTLKLVARWADGCNFGGGNPDTIRQKVEVLRGHCDALGRDITDIEISTSLEDVHLLAPGEDPERVADWTNGQYTLDQYRKRFRVFTADELTTRIEEIVGAGAQHVIIYLGGVAYNQDMIYRFARDVMPRFA